MFRRRLLGGSVFFCALGAVAVMAASAGGGDPVGIKSQVAEVSSGLVKQIYDDQDAFRRKPPIGGGGGVGGGGWGRREDVKEFRIPSNHCYTAIMIVPAKSSGSQRLRMVGDRDEFPITVQGGQTYTLPFIKGWRPDCAMTICGDLYEGDFEVWGIAEDGPVAFPCTRR